MSRLLLIVFIMLSLVACASRPPEKATLATLKYKNATITHKSAVKVSLEATILRYRALLKESASGPFHREALLRLADLQLEMAENLKYENDDSDLTHRGLQTTIGLYQQFLSTYPGDKGEEEILYQLAKTYDLDGLMEDSLATLERLLRIYPQGKYAAEAWFRSGEINFSIRNYTAAESAYRTIVEHFPDSLFYEHALYKYAWTLYSKNRYDDSLRVFFQLLDLKRSAGELAENGYPDSLSLANREMIEDSLRAISPALSNLGVDDPIAKYFPANGPRTYEPLIRRRLGEWYVAKERYGDAAAVFLGLARRYPDHPLAPTFYQYAIQAYQAGDFSALALEAKSRFVEIYGVDSHYWQVHGDKIHDGVSPLLAGYIKDLAAYYHAAARRDKAAKNFDAAAKWYAVYLRSFPAGSETPGMHFLLAEALYEGEHYEQAITAYEQTAYGYDTHANSAEAGYKALLTYWEREPRLPDAKRGEWRRRAIASALRFSDRFPQDSRVDGVLARSAEELYALHDFPAAVDVAQRLLARSNQRQSELRRTAWTIQGHAQYEMGDYGDAETSYRELIAMYSSGDPKRAAVLDNLAASIYKQGDHSRSAGALRDATRHFLRIREVAPDSAIRATAQYDAAAAFIELQDWPDAASVLKEFRKQNLGDSRLQNGVTEKLAFVYAAMGQKANAAREMEAVANIVGDTERRRDALWQAAALYENLGKISDAIRLNERYAREFPQPFDEAMETRHRLCVLYEQLGRPDKTAYWLSEIIAADRAAGVNRTNRSRQLAAEAALSLATPLLKNYQRARLTVPLDKSLKKKKQAMEKIIAAYRQALEYQVAEVSTAATYHLGEVYGDFAKALLTSEPPPGLSADELEQYKLLLEEQAAQFEDKAIEIHGNYLHFIKSGIYDAWVKDSLDALAKLYPARYAKTEERETYIDVMH